MKALKRFPSETVDPVSNGSVVVSFVKNASDAKVRVSNGSGGSVLGDLQIEICGMQRCVTSLAWISLCPLSPICSIAKTLISLGLRSDVFLARDTQNIRDAGKQLDAQYILEGSVFRSGEQLRINAQLVRVRDDSPLWSGRYDEELRDIFAIQDE